MAVGLRSVSQFVQTQGHAGVGSVGSALGSCISGRACQNAGGLQVLQAMGWGFSSHCPLLRGGHQGGVWWEGVSMEKESPVKGGEGEGLQRCKSSWGGDKWSCWRTHRQQDWRWIFKALQHAAEHGFRSPVHARWPLRCSALDLAQLSSHAVLDNVFSFPSHKPELPSTAPAQLSQSVLPLAGVRSPPGLPVSQPVSSPGLLVRAGLG